MAAFCLLETATIPVSIFHYICHVTAHFSLFSVPFPCCLCPGMLTNQRDTDTDTVYGSSSASCACTVEGRGGGAESLSGLLAVIIAGFCFHFCCLMLLILLTIALKVVHRTLRCANNKNAKRKRRCKVYRTHGHAPCRRPCPLPLLFSASSRPRVLQKITKILFAAMQLLPKKKHRAKAEVGVAHSGCSLLAAAAFPFVSLYSHAAQHSESCLGAACTASVSVEKFHFPYDAWHFLPLRPPPLPCSAAVVIAGMIKYEINF